jgi:photosystem II stability/assembly factor-like uncharacterized protein
MANEPHPAATGPVALLIGTKKGAFVLRGDARRACWELSDPILLGHIVHHIVHDARDGGTALMAARTGHLGPTVLRSVDGCRTWEEAARPPAFAKAAAGNPEPGRVVEHVFWLAPGHAREAGVWYAGTSPQGLFRSEDDGRAWEGVRGFNDHPMRVAWCGGGQDGTPDGPKMHSILVDPRDSRHLYIGMSGGGVFESVDRGSDWQPLNQGCAMDFAPGPAPEFGHDPHCVVLHPLRPDRLYQQNHCGIYRMERPEGRWIRGDNMPRDVGDIGFPIVVHPHDPDVAWVIPMDGTDVWPRTSPGGRPAVYVTRDAGATWRRQDTGLPAEKAWFTVLRQAMAADHHAPVGVYFGTTGGEIWASDDEGEHWRCLVRHLPQIYAVEVAQSLP